MEKLKCFGGISRHRGWALCNGRLLTIQDNSPLFSIIGATYGGDGETIFALPDLRGRVPVHAGDGPDLSFKNLGEKSATETVKVKDDTQDHSAVKTKNARTVKKGRKKSNIVFAPLPAQSHISRAPNKSNTQPYLSVNFIKTLQRTFPSGN